MVGGGYVMGGWVERGRLSSCLCIVRKMLCKIINEPSSFPVQVKTADTHNFLAVLMLWL